MEPHTVFLGRLSLDSFLFWKFTQVERLPPFEQSFRWICVTDTVYLGAH